MQASIVFLLQMLACFRPVFSKPAFFRFQLLVLGWILAPGRHTITEVLIALQISDRYHHASFHRFFSQTAWSKEALEKRWLAFLLSLIPKDQPLQVALDDTLTHHRGEHIFGRGTHLDAVRSSKAYKVLALGHVWVVLCLLMRLPGSERLVAIPIGFRLYLPQKVAEKEGQPFRTKLTLAAELFAWLREQVPDRAVDVLVDGAYATEEVVRHLPTKMRLISRIRKDAAIYEPIPIPHAGSGCSVLRGPRLSTPEKWLSDPSIPWTRGIVEQYGQERAVRWKEKVVLWPRVNGLRPVKVVVVEGKPGDPVEAFFSTDTSQSGTEILEQYAKRWSIEVTFREMKQEMGLADSPVQTQASVERMVPFVGVVYGLVRIWYTYAGQASPWTGAVVRPWYRTRTGASFGDMLRCLRAGIADAGLVELIEQGGSFTKPPEADLPPYREAA